MSDKFSRPPQKLRNIEIIGDFHGVGEVPYLFMIVSENGYSLQWSEALVNEIATLCRTSGWKETMHALRALDDEMFSIINDITFVVYLSFYGHEGGLTDLNYRAHQLYKVLTYVNAGCDVVPDELKDLHEVFCAGLPKKKGIQ
jgi:hypothetical protein